MSSAFSPPVLTQAASSALCAGMSGNPPLALLPLSTRTGPRPLRGLPWLCAVLRADRARAGNGKPSRGPDSARWPARSDCGESVHFPIARGSFRRQIAEGIPAQPMSTTHRATSARWDCSSVHAPVSDVALAEGSGRTPVCAQNRGIGGCSSTKVSDTARLQHRKEARRNGSEWHPWDQIWHHFPPPRVGPEHSPAGPAQCALELRSSAIPAPPHVLAARVVTPFRPMVRDSGSTIGWHRPILL